MTDEPVSAQRERTGFREVFAQELRSWIARQRLKRGPPEEVKPEQFTPERALDLHLAGLALSGGGIRSATFNLGLLQALADQGVLAQVDYLSTVSGGGYIGASLTSLCASGAGVAPDTFPFRTEGGEERPEVSHLRMHGGYLAPRRGLLRIDTWRMISSYLSGLALILLTIAVLVAFVATVAPAWVEGSIVPGLEQKPPHDLWMALVQKRLTDVDFERVPDRRLRAEFIDWAGSFQEVILDGRLKKELDTWIAEARKLPASRLRELVDVWVDACREYANNRERLWNDLVNAITFGNVQTFSSKMVDQFPGSRFDGVELQNELYRNHKSGTLREWWIREVEDSLFRGGFQKITNDKLKEAFEKWRQEDFSVLTGEKGLELVPRRGVRNSMNRFGDSVRTGIRYLIARRSAPDISLESLRQEVEGRKTREDVDQWIAQWDRERISKNLLDNTGYVISLNVQATRAELSNDVWRHSVLHAGALFTPVGVGLGLWAVWGILFLSASVFPWRIRQPAIRGHLTDAMGYALASVAVLAALSSVPFVYAAIASFQLSEVRVAGLSTLVVSMLSLLGSLRAEGKGQFARTLKRFLFALGAWAFIALLCVSVLYFVLHRQLQGTDSFSRSLNVLFFTMILLALITDINRASLLHFYRDRLATAFVIRRSAPRGKPGAEATDQAPAVRVGTGVGSGRHLAHKVIRGLYSLGGWPLAALLIAAFAFFGQRAEQAGFFLISFVVVFVFVASGGFHAVIRWYKDKLWTSGAMAHVRGDEKATEIVRNDDLRLSTLATSESDAPYHLINAAVNLSGSEDLKLRGRKADFFLLSPLYCGSKVTGYVRTDRFERSLDDLATAMAVSGAAANPLYGRATHRGFGFLMALCNLRLGMWVQNPRYVRHVTGFRGWLKEALLPLRRWWPWYIVMELLGQSDEKRRHVNVSDGGHIENLGVFELLRRKCRVIIASDAGADADYGFGDLADLTRMARVDLGVEIGSVDLEMLSPRESTGLSARHAVSGEIKYPCKDGRAHLIYVKAALTEDDPQDLHGYKRREPGFPHESTLNQFFNEGQFESYRMLGYQSGLAAADIFQRLIRT